MIFSHSFSVKVKLDPKHMNLSGKEIKNELIKQLKKQYGNTCKEIGYIFDDDIKITYRSQGYLDTIIMDGGINYDVDFTAKICYLSENEKLKCQIIKSNEECLLLRTTEIKYQDAPLVIFMPIRYHNEEKQKLLKKKKIGDIIYTTVLGSRFKTNIKPVKMNIIVVLQD